MADAANTEVPKPEKISNSEEKQVHPPEPAAAEIASAAPGETSTDSAPASKDETAVESAKERELDADEKEDEAAEKADSKPAGTVDAPAVSNDKEVKEASAQKSPLQEFDAKLPEILKEIGHDEMWGVKLVTPASSHVPTGIVLQKFLNANDGDLTKAVDQFTGALNFRKEKKPLELLTKQFNANKFADLGAVTVYALKDSPVPEVFTWNIYGNVKGKMEEVFVPLEEYVYPFPWQPNDSWSLSFV